MDEKQLRNLLREQARQIVTRLETKIDETKEELQEAIDLIEIPAASDEEIPIDEEPIEEDDYFQADPDEAAIEDYEGERSVPAEIPKPPAKKKKPGVFDKLMPGKKKGRTKKEKTEPAEDEDVI